MTQVYSSRIIGAMTTALQNMLTEYCTKTRLLLSPDEFVGAFIDPEHVTQLKNVEELVGFIGVHNFETVLPAPYGGSYLCQAGFYQRAPIILPRYVRGGLQPTCPPEVRQKIDEWGEDRFRIGSAAADVAHALPILNSTCGDAEAMTLMLPCFPTLLGKIDTREDAKSVKRARKLAAGGRFGSLPAMQRAVKQRLLEASAIINSLTMAADAPEQTAAECTAAFFVAAYNGPASSILGGSAFK